MKYRIRNLKQKQNQRKWKKLFGMRFVESTGCQLAFTWGRLQYGSKANHEFLPVTSHVSQSITLLERSLSEQGGVFRFSYVPQSHVTQRVAVDRRHPTPIRDPTVSSSNGTMVVNDAVPQYQLSPRSCNPRSFLSHVLGSCGPVGGDSSVLQRMA
jgi:hypothetical protein